MITQSTNKAAQCKIEQEIWIETECRISSHIFSEEQYRKSRNTLTQTLFFGGDRILHFLLPLAGYASHAQTPQSPWPSAPGSEPEQLRVPFPTWAEVDETAHGIPPLEALRSAGDCTELVSRHDSSLSPSPSGSPSPLSLSMCEINVTVRGGFIAGALLTRSTPLMSPPANWAIESREVAFVLVLISCNDATEDYNIPSMRSRHVEYGSMCLTVVGGWDWSSLGKVGRRFNCLRVHGKRD